MNENVQNMITLSTAIVLFLSACFFTLGLTGQVHLTLDQAASETGGQMKSVHSTLKTATLDMFSGSQALIMAVDQLKNGVRIEADGAEVTESDPVLLHQHSIFQFEAKYHAVYKRDIYGRLIEIRFNKIFSEEVHP